MFDSLGWEYKSSEDLKEHFSRYCTWCWYSGYGNCKTCEKMKNKTLLRLKLKEFKANK